MLSCKRQSLLLCALSACALLTPVSLGQDALAVTVQNDTGRPAADLHVRFAGAGGVLIVDPLTVVAGGGGACPVPSVTSNPPMVTDTVVIDWGVECVPTGTKVTFMVQTPAGPLTFVDCFWTDAGGNNMGGCTLCGIVQLPPPRLGAWKVQYRYSPLGFVFYTLWFHPPGQNCWWRWCCNPFGWQCQTRAIWCPFTTRTFRLFEVPVWIPVTPWVNSGFLVPAYWWQRTTIPPPPHLRARGPWFNGPPPDANLFRPWFYGLNVFYTDDGQQFRPGVDFSSAFYDAWLRMQVIAPLDPNNIDPVGPPAPGNFAETTQALAPGFFGAGQAVMDLVPELDDVLFHEPDPLVGNIRVDVEIVALSLTSIGQQLGSGVFNPPDPYFQLRDALGALGDDLRLLGTNMRTQRFQNAADILNVMLEGANEAGAQVAAGLPNTASQDLFLWGLMNRLKPNMQHFATTMLPHVCIQFDLGDYVWAPTSSEGATVVIQNASNGEILDEFVTPVSDLGTIYLPIFDQNVPLRVRFKLPTHLSRVVEIPNPSDGLRVNAGPLVPADVNGDNCVDAADLLQVSNDQGRGGPDAPIIPSSDVNADGLIDATDLSITQANIGQCGDDLPGGAPCPGDVDGDGVISLRDLAQLLAAFGSSKGDPRYNPNADFNNDGVISLEDLAVQLGVFGTACP